MFTYLKLFNIYIICDSYIALKNSGQQCHTTQESIAEGGKYAPCALPFKFDGKLRDACITEFDPDGKYWCSTKVDENFVHVGGGGFWGFCADSCPPINATTTITRDFGNKVRSSKQLSIFKELKK